MFNVLFILQTHRIASGQQWTWKIKIYKVLKGFDWIVNFNKRSDNKQQYRTVFTFLQRLNTFYETAHVSPTRRKNEGSRGYESQWPSAVRPGCGKLPLVAEPSRILGSVLRRVLLTTSTVSHSTIPQHTDGMDPDKLCTQHSKLWEILLF